MQQWQYTSLYRMNNGKVIRTEYHNGQPHQYEISYNARVENSNEVIRRETAKLGQDGWELINMIKHIGTPNLSKQRPVEEWIFKRPLT